MAIQIDTHDSDQVIKDEKETEKAPDQQPRLEHNREYLVAPPDATLEEWLAICQMAFTHKQTVGFSRDDAGIGNLARKTAILYDIPQEKRQALINWYDENYPHTNVLFRNRPAVNKNK